MKERPILFSGPMVRAILEGRKTQTRRIVKWEPRSSGLPKTHLHDFSRAFVDPGLGGGRYLKVPFVHPEDGWESDPKNDTITRCYCPYGYVGERLWVRETFSIEEGTRDHTGKDPDFIQYKADGVAQVLNPDGTAKGEFFKSDNSVVAKWRPSIFMPRSASRITLEITGVRVERLHDISEADAKAEGCKESVCLPGDCGTFAPDFFNRWVEINGSESYEANPWVWVIEFKKV